MRMSLLLCLVGLVACSNSGTSFPDGGLVDAAVMNGDGPVSNDDLGDFPDFASTDLGPRSVTGHVLNYVGLPDAGFTVSVGTSKTTTDANGAFTLTVGAGAYDVTVVGNTANAPTFNHVVKYLGLTRDDPTLRILSTETAPATTHHATYSGSCTGLATPLPMGATGYVAADAEALNGANFDDTSSSLSFSNTGIDWQGATPLTTTLRAAFTNAGAVIGYGTASITFAEGQSVALASPIAQTVPTTKTLTGTLTMPTGTTNGHYDTHVLFGGGAVGASLAYGALPADGVLSLPMPVINDSFIRISAHARFGDSNTFLIIGGLAPDAALGAQPLLLPPTGNAVAGAPNAVARDVVFSVQAGQIGAVRIFVFASAEASYTLVTMASSTPFPDATALGIANPPAGVMLNSSFIEYAYDSTDGIAGDKLYSDERSVPAGKPYRIGAGSYASFAFTD